MRGATGVLLLLPLIASSTGCAPVAAYRSARGSADVTVRDAIAARRDSVVIVVYGDNRRGLRMFTTSWGLPAIARGLRTSDPAAWAWGLLNVPVAAVQSVVPTLDGFQDLAAMTVTHRPNGGHESQVLGAIASLDPDLVINTGDLVEDGRRGVQWEDFARRHAALRARAPYLAAVGNHEATATPLGAGNWRAAVGGSDRGGRFWSAFDVADPKGGVLARFLILDSNVFTDPHGTYADTVRRALASEQLAWADSALSAPARWKFVVFHHPLVSAGHYLTEWARSDPAPLRARVRLMEMFHEHGVTAVLAGHEHLFMRTWLENGDGRYGFWQVTTGGGGAPLVEVPRQRRRRASVQTLPDGWRLRSAGDPRSVYHVCRLVLSPGGDGRDAAAALTVLDVGPSGRLAPAESFRLDRPPQGP